VSNDKKWLVNTLEEETAFDASSFCTSMSESEPNPIDDFYSYSRDIIKLGSPSQLTENPILGRLLLLALVSGVELYFRSILSGIIKHCPIARKHAFKQQISLENVEYYGFDEIGLGLLEGVSLADSGSIKKETKRLTGIELKNGKSSVWISLLDFDKICQFRHATAHSRGQLSARNLRELGISVDRTNRSALSVSLKEFQNAAQICHNCVQAYNRYMYRKFIERWLGNHILTSEWDTDSKKFSNLFKLFKSEIDNVAFNLPKEAYMGLMPAILNSLTKAVKLNTDN
jgi:hypothetical protein